MARSRDGDWEVVWFGFIMFDVLNGFGSQIGNFLFDKFADAMFEEINFAGIHF